MINGQRNAMNTITKISEIIELSKEAESKGTKLYIRWSRGYTLDKKQGRSRDQVSGQYHNGLSAQNVRYDRPELLALMLQEYQFLRRKDSEIYCWIFSGEKNGTDTDDAPTIDAESIVPIGRVADDLIEKCSAYNMAYWACQKTGWRDEEKCKIANDLLGICIDG